MDKKWFDDGAFYIVPQKWGTVDSYDKEDKCIITSLTEETCIAATRWYLKKLSDGGFEETKTYDSIVGGKL